MKYFRNAYTKTGIAAAAGALLGNAYYYFIGCASGTCPITSSPYISTIYGSVMGVLLFFPGKKKNNDAAGKQKDVN